MEPTKQKKVALVIGGSRGIGRQIAISLAEAGYAVIVSSKSTSNASSSSTSTLPDPNSLASTINTVALEITHLDNTATPIPVDVRSPTSISHLFSLITQLHGRLDALIYNSGAVWWAPISKTPLKRFQLLQDVNINGLYATIQAALPLMEKGGWKTRVVVVCPPIYSRFFRGKAAYAVGKVGMSVLVRGLAMDWEREGEEMGGMAITGLWPAAAIRSAATEVNVRARSGGSGAEMETERLGQLRKPTIFADACLAILRAPAGKVNGLMAIDEDILREFEGVRDFAQYSVVPGTIPRRMVPKRFPDLTVEEEDDEGVRMDSNELRVEKLFSKL